MPMSLLRFSLSTQAIIIFFVCCGGYFFSMFFRLSLSVITPDLVQNFGLNSGQMSSLAVIHSIFFGAAQVPVGIALDRYGPRKVMIFLCIVNLIGVVCFFIASDYVTLLLGRALMGVGTSAALMGTMVIIANWYPPNRFATISSFAMCIGIIGQMLSSAPLAMLTNNFGWRMALGLMSIFLVVQLILFLLTVKDYPPITENTKATGEKPEEHLPFSALFKIKEFWYISYIAFITYGFMLTYLSLWGGVHYIYGLGFSQTQAGYFLLSTSVGYFFGVPFFSWLSDRLEVRAKLLAPCCFIVSGLLVVFCFLQSHFSPIIFILFSFSIGIFMGPGPLIYAMIKDVTPKDLAARGITTINLATMAGAASIVQIYGLIFDPDLSKLNSPMHFAPLWWVMSLGMAICGILALRLESLRKKKLKNKIYQNVHGN